MGDHSDDAADLARLFEEAEPFTGLDLDDFAAVGDQASERAAPQPQPQGRKGTGGRDRGLFPWLFWRALVASAPYPARDWRRWAHLANLDPSDTDNATRLVSHFGRDLRVRVQEGGQKPLYVAWTGTHWDDVTGIYGARALAQKVGGLIKLEAAFLRPTAGEKAAIAAGVMAEAKDDEDRTPAEMIAMKKAEEAAANVGKRRTKRIEFGISCKNDGRIAAMLNQAAPRLLITPDAFNTDPLRLATPTQTLIWSRVADLECPDPGVTRHIVTFEARDGHDRGDLITTMIPVSYDPKAECPKFKGFLTRFQPHVDDRRFIQVASGVGLLGVAPQVLIFHFGEGANGKSVFLEVLCRVLGALAAGLPAEAIAGDDQGGGLKPSPEIARLFGKRFVRISEIKEGAQLQEAFVKRITGSEAFPARNLFEGYFEFKPQFVPHMSGNGYPKISGTDNGIWRRMRIVKWPVVLADAEQREFEDVVGEMMAEAPGILRWLVEGASMFLAEGLIAPASVMAETGEMRAKMDPVKRFVEACLDMTGDAEHVITGGNLFRAYTDWAAVCGDHNPVSMTRFGRDITKHKGIQKDTSGSHVLYRGLRLRPEPRTPGDDDRDWRDPRDL